MADLNSGNTVPRRPAWVEIDRQRLRRNFDIIFRDKPAGLKVLSVVKDQAYGHGAVAVARAAIEAGASFLGVVTLDEAIELRENGIEAPILLFGERMPEELPVCVQYRLTCCVNDRATAEELAGLVRQQNRAVPVHVEIDTGMSRYGIRWERAAAVVRDIAATPGLVVEGIMSHFAQSDESDKSYAMLQLERFRHVLSELEKSGLRIPIRHMCNTGGYLDLPMAHFDMVRMGILPLGVYPSQVCRRIPGLEPVMSVKTRIAAIRDIREGDKVGYGMRYTAPGPRRIAILPLGYGDGYPRVRNAGHVLIHGRRASIVGGNAMDAMMVDVTDIPGVQPWDEVVIMGRQGEEEISVHEIARLKGSVSYDILAGWRWRLPRVYL